MASTTPIHHPVVAALIDVAMRPLYRFRRSLIPLARGVVLEVGVGTGLNLPLYDATQVERVVGIEPDKAMRARAAHRDAAVPVELTSARAETLPFDDHTFDTAVVTFVLCSIDDPAAALGEIRRVLKPRGTMLFAEHVCSASPFTARVQGALTPLWRRCAGGCRLNRDAGGAIEAAGFVLEEMERRGSTRTLSPIVFGRARTSAHP